MRRLITGRGCHVDNSEKVAEKHYLHVTDGHITAGSLVEAVEKVDPKVGPDLTLSQIVACLIERWDSMNGEEKLAVQLCIDGTEVSGRIATAAPDTA